MEDYRVAGVRDWGRVEEEEPMGMFRGETETGCVMKASLQKCFT